LAPEGWAASLAAARQRSEQRVRSATDMSIYELHVRDFSASDESVRPAWRGKFLAFTEPASAGMRHLKALAAAGITDVHLLPVFDIASIPETGCKAPAIAAGAGDSAEPQAAVRGVAATDCYNWGYDPLHYSAPEGSYATDASDGAKRLIEFRQMVMALHDAGLRVGMDVVYNHTPASGQNATSVLDRIVPGYYQRLNAQGEVERSTCCANTATEHRMMGKLMSDSVLLWAQAHGIDSFRFDLMGHQPRDVMVAIQARLKAALGREVQLLGEGWNFGEVADGARFVQASQLSLGGTGIGSFSDRGRDALRGGGAGDSGEAMFSRQGWISGLFTDRNAMAPASTAQDLMRSADLVRVGLAGTLRNFSLITATGEARTLAQVDYAGQPAGYASQPAEVVNYVENHDNQTLYDSLAMKLPRATPSADRARVQTLAAAVVAFSQGVAYFHAGQDILRSKSLDRNSYDSGDWFNRLDWSYQTNHFGIGLPPEADNGRDWPLLRPLLADPALRPGPADIAFARDAFRDLLKIRASSSLFHLTSAEAVSERLRFFNTGPSQNPALLVASLRGDLKGERLAGANFGEIVYFINVDKAAQTLQIDEFKGRALVLHPVQRAPSAADPRPAEARFEPVTGRFTVPARTAVVWVAN
jgi:pullulanase-type alpha-1,6-glucosidase